MRNHLLLCAFLLVCGGLNAQTQLLGSPTTLVKNRGAFMSDSLLYIPKRTKAPSDSGAIRYNIADSAVYVWTGYQWRAVSASTGVYVPYTGATADVDLGNFSLNAKSLHIKGTAGQGHLGLKHQSNTPSLSASESAIYANVNGDLAWHNDNLYSSIFKTSLTTASRTYTFQNKSYTVGDSADIALKVNISDTATMLTPYVRAAGYGLTKSSQSLLVDTAAMATRARVQKGIDSLGEITVKLTGGQTIAGNKIFSNDITFNAGSYFKGSLLLYNPDDAIGYNQLKSKSTAVNFRTIYFPNDSGTVILDKTLSSYIGSSFISGTTNYVPKFTGTSAIGNSQIFDNGTNVGIGTASPTNKFVVSNGGALGFEVDPAASTGTVLDLYSYNRSTSAYRPMRIYALDYRINTETTERFRITSDGHVGIGTTTPALSNNASITDFTVTKSGGATNIATINLQGDRAGDGAVQSRIGTINFWQTTNAIARIDGLRYNADNYGGIAFSVNPGSSLTEVMRINSNGELMIGSQTDLGAYTLQNSGAFYNTAGAVLAATSGSVGIGTASPSAKLQVDGAITATSGPYPSAVNGIHMHFSNGIGYIQAEQGGTAYRQLSLNGDFLTFVAQGTERMRIKSDGEVLIGTTSDAGFYPLQVSGNIYNTNDAHFSVTGGGVGIGIGSSPSKLWIYGGSLSTSSTGGSGFASRLTTGRTGTFDANTLTSFHNYFDSESIEIASGSSNTYVSGISVTGRSATNYSGSVRFITSSSERMRINPDGELLVNTTSDAGAYALQVAGAIYNTTTITTGAPTSGTAKPWRLGEAATVSPTSPNRTIRVEIDGTVYYIHAKTTND